MNANSEYICRSCHIVFRGDKAIMAQLMCVSEARLAGILSGEVDATQMDVILTEMAVCEQAKYVQGNLQSLRGFMHDFKPEGRYGIRGQEVVYQGYGPYRKTTDIRQGILDRPERNSGRDPRWV